MISYLLFNPSKCQVIHVTRRKTPFERQYSLHGCVLESTLSTQADSEMLQKDLEQLAKKWEKLWDMIFYLLFYPSKCQVIHVTRRKTPFETQYSLHGCVLESVPSAKYLGVTISESY